MKKEKEKQEENESEGFKNKLDRERLLPTRRKLKGMFRGKSKKGMKGRFRREGRKNMKKKFREVKNSRERKDKKNLFLFVNFLQIFLIFYLLPLPILFPPQSPPPHISNFTIESRFLDLPLLSPPPCNITQPINKISPESPGPH